MHTKMYSNGPNRCFLCKQDFELLDHLFVNFPFSRSVWSEVLLMVKCTLGKVVLEHKDLPCYVLQGLWPSRNKMSFQDSSLSIGWVAHSIRLSYRVIEGPSSIFLRPLLQPMINTSFTGGFFDGAYQGTPCNCGDGVIPHVLYIAFLFSTMLLLEQTIDLIFFLCGCF